MQAAPNITPQTPLTNISTAQQRRSCDKYNTAYVAHVIKKAKLLFYYSVGFSLILAFISQLRVGFYILGMNNVKSQSITIMGYALVFLLSSISILFTRFAYAKIWTTKPPSAAAQGVYSFTLKSNWILTVFYSLTSYFTIRWYFSYILKVNYARHLYQQPPGHFSGANQLNLECIFIFLYSLAIGVAFTVDFICRERSIIRLNNVQQPIYQDIKTSIATIVSDALRLSAKTFGICYILFVFTKSIIYYSFAYLFGTFSRVLDSPVVGFHWLNLYLFYHLIFGGALTLSAWNITHRLFDVIFPNTVAITDPFANQYDCLIDGLSPTNKDLVRCSAFSELAVLACQRPEKRVELFNYVKNDIKESAWYRIMSECILVIQELETGINAEYNGPKPVTQPAPVTKPDELITAKRVQLVQNSNIYHVDKKQVPYLDDRTGLLFNTAAQLAYNEIPSAYPTVEKMAESARKNVVESQIIKLIRAIELKTGDRSGVCQSILANTVTRRVQDVFRKYQLVICAIQSLGSLTAASVNEDQMGYVQYNIGSVLDTLLGLLELVEKFVKTPPAEYLKLNNGGERVVLEEPTAIIRALQEAIYQIVGSFSQYTDGFSVNEKYQQKWQSFLVYNE
ncbi:hypothetical protein K501DRAFT_319881 [Backusella circina FSU 941]|nr:hypothetical protein K501DRAFT_319881 [Backusella circina FSU 941]